MNAVQSVCDEIGRDSDSKRPSFRAWASEDMQLSVNEKYETTLLSYSEISRNKNKRVIYCIVRNV